MKGADLLFICYNVYMGILTLLISLICISTGTFALGVMTGRKLGSSYKKDAALKTSFVFAIINVLALALAFIIGRLLFPWLYSSPHWLVFVMFFLISIQLILESIERSPSLNFTDIVQNTYMIKVAIQTALPSFLFGFAIAMVNTGYLAAALFLSALFTFFTILFGIVHGNTFNQTVLHSRMQLIAGIVMLVITIRFLLQINI